MEDHLHFFSKRELNFFIFELDIPRPDMKFQFNYSWMVWLSGRGKLDPRSGSQLEPRSLVDPHVLVPVG